MRRVRTRLREAVTMEDIIVGSIALLLIAYLFIALIRPEIF
jgi:K+-transporting ATPase KdpF subunit